MMALGHPNVWRRVTSGLCGWRFLSLALLVLFGLAQAQAQTQPARVEIKDLARGAVFYLPLDGNTVPRYAAGGPSVTATEASFVQGVAGQAAVVKSAGIAVPAPGNFNRVCGSVSFWVRPAWTPNDPAYTGDRELVNATNFSLKYSSANHTLRFMTGAVTTQDGYRWDFEPATDTQVAAWKPDAWHHVVITWDAGRGVKALYLDGKLVGSHATTLIRTDLPREKEPVTLAKIDAPGDYDEWVMWDRALSAEEVATLAAQPVEVAKILAQQLPATPQPVAWPVQFSIYDTKPEQTVIDPGATFTAQIPVHNTGAEAFHASVKFGLVDFWLKERESRTLDLQLAPGEQRTLEVPFAAPESGIFKVALRLEHQGKTFSKDVASFAAFPQLNEPLSDGSFFGHHVNSWGDGAVQQAARLGLRWNRGHNMLQFSWWLRVEPKPGEFEWDYAKHYERMHQYHMNMLGQFYKAPAWAKVSPERAAEGPYDLAALGEYVNKTVSHFKDVRYWEIWNEPDVGIFWNGTPQQFAQVCKTAYEAAKKADPTVTVLNAGYTHSSWRWAEIAAEAGAMKYADAISYHAYYQATTPPEQLEQEIQDQMTFWHGMAKKHAGHDLPIWNTEGGSADTTWLEGFESPKLPPLEARPAPNWRQATLAAVQTDAFLQAAGVVRSFQYFWTPAVEGGIYDALDAIDLNCAPKPKLLARAVMARELDEAAMAGVIRRPEGRLYANVYRTVSERPWSDSAVVLLWTGRGGEVAIDAAWPGKLVRRVDIMGNDRPVGGALVVNEEPVYLHVAAEANAVLAALKAAKITVKTEPKPLASAQVLAGADAPKVPTLPPFAAPSEDTNATFSVDLRPYANMGFADSAPGDGAGGWSDEGPLNDMRDMPMGHQVWHGVPFEILDPATNSGKAILTLRGQAVTPTLPEKVSIALPPGRVRCLYFLHAAAWGVPAGAIGKYVVHYQDGTSLELPIVIPQNINNWWNGYEAAEESRPVSVRVSNTKDGKPGWRYLRVWEWQNPRRNVPITSVDAISASGKQTPILIAITGVR